MSLRWKKSYNSYRQTATSTHHPHQNRRFNIARPKVGVVHISEDAMGGVGKRRGVENLTNDTPPKRGFGPPLVWYVFHPPQVSVLCFSCRKNHDRADQKLFRRGPKIFGRARSLVRFPPPIRFAPPHITAQIFCFFRFRHFAQSLTPDIPQSEIAARNFYDRVRFWAKNWAKFWTKFSGHFRASCAVQNDPPKVLPKFLPVYHSMSCHSCG